MVRYGGSSASSYLADPTSAIPSHCASIVVTSTLRVNMFGTIHTYQVQGFLSIYLFHTYHTFIYASYILPVIPFCCQVGYDSGIIAIVTLHPKPFQLCGLANHNRHINCAKKDCTYQTFYTPMHDFFSSVPPLWQTSYEYESRAYRYGNIALPVSYLPVG